MKTTNVAGGGTIARRTLLRAVGGTIAGAVAASHDAHGQQPGAPSPAHDHAAPGRASQGEAQGAAAASALPRVLDAHELATLNGLGELLVPGSSKAGVPDMLDRLMAVETPEELRRFRSALAAFEREARMRHRAAWLELGEAERIAILTQASTAPASPVKPGESKAERPPLTLRDHHDHLRGLVSRAYFATEAGMTELGWTGMEFWEALPECRPE